MSLLWLEENILGYSHFFDDTEDGLQEAKHVMRERAKAIRQAGVAAHLPTLRIVRIQAGTFRRDGHFDSSETVYRYLEDDEDEEEEEEKEEDDTNANQNQ